MKDRQQTHRPAHPSYGFLLREAAANHKDGPVSIRALEKLTGFSYQHIRTVMNGAPVGSREFNEALCGALNLDTAKMWLVAEAEKTRKKLRTGVMRRAPNQYQGLLLLIDGWEFLEVSQQESLTKQMERFLGGNHAALSKKLSKGPRK